MRHDGRKLNQLRPVTVKTQVNRYAEGSCLIQMGHTHVLCTATVEDGVPRFLKNSGKGWVTAEYSMLPRSCGRRIPRDISKGKISGRTQEIQRLIGRALRAVVDFKVLGEKTILIDCDVIQGDGGTRCASITGAYIALHQALKKLVKEGTLVSVPLNAQVAAVSVGICNGKPSLDLNYEEDSTAEVDMNIIMTDAGKFIEIQGTAEQAPFSDVEMKKLIQLARAGIKSLIQIQRKALKA